MKIINEKPKLFPLSYDNLNVHSIPLISTLPLDEKMDKKSLKSCDGCPHELIHGVACDWQPKNCRFHHLTQNRVSMFSHKHDAWAANVAEESEYDAVKSFS